MRRGLPQSVLGQPIDSERSLDLKLSTSLVGSKVGLESAIDLRFTQIKVLHLSTSHRPSIYAQISDFHFFAKKI